MDVNNNSDAVNNQNNSENSNSYNAENSSQSAQSYVNQQSDVYNQPQYDQSQYQQNQYQQDQYQQSQYQQSQYQQNQYQPTQPQYAQSQQTYAQQSQYAQAQYGQPQYAPQQYAQSQYGQQQYGQPQYAQPQYGSQYGAPQYGSPQGYAQMQNGNPQGYAQSQYGVNQYGGNQYGGPQYGMPGMPQYGAPRGYAQSSLYNRFNEHEKLVNTFCSQWNEKEIGLVIILSIAVAIGTYLILDHPIQTFGYGYSLSTAWLYFAYNLIPLAVVLGFAQVARKNNFVIISSIVWFIVQAIYHIWNHNYFDIKYFIFYMISTLVFIILLEVFQRQFVVRKRSNIGGYILGVLISTFVYVIIIFIVDIVSGSSISYFYLEHFAYTFITLSILPIILAAILRAFGFAKFLNPKREEMNM